MADGGRGGVLHMRPVSPAAVGLHCLHLVCLVVMSIIRWGIQIPIRYCRAV